MIVDKKGFVLTNNHVAHQATKVQVTLNGDQTQYTAKVIGIDEETDLAILKIEVARHDLPYAKLGNSDSCASRGLGVLAIGNPFALQGSVTAGIISAGRIAATWASSFRDLYRPTRPSIQEIPAGLS